MKKLLLLSSLLISGALFSQTWTTQNTGFVAANRGISDISIVDANTVWAMAYDGQTTTNNIQEFTRTSNGGTTWTPGTIGLGNTALQITNISAVSATTAFAGAFDPVNGLGGVWKTSNSGTTWTQQNTTAYTTATKSWFNIVHFFDANNGVTIGDPAPSTDFEIYYTTNGGTTWTASPAIQIPNAQTEEYGYNNAVTFVGSNIWFVTSKGRIYKSTNMGLSWTVSQSPITDFGGATVSGKLYFSDANNGFILSSEATNNFYTTTNGGTTWSSGTTFTGTHKLLCPIPNTTTIVGTSLAPPTGSSYSLNNGTTWTNIDTATPPQRGVSKFLNGSTGWAGGFSTNATTGGIFKFSGTLANNTFKNNTFTAYPNPVNDVVTITNKDNATFNTISITDINGRTVKSVDANNVSELEVNVSELNAGIYFMNIGSENGKTVKKFIKN